MRTDLLFQGSVPVSQTGQRGLCHFCGQPTGQRVTTFHCRGFIRLTPPGVTLYRPGSLTACATCTLMVRARSWRKITRRVIAAYRRQYPDADAAELAAVRVEHASMLQLVGRNLTDPTTAGGAA
jgi:hypothetical protein